MKVKRSTHDTAPLTIETTEDIYRFALKLTDNSEEAILLTKEIVPDIADYNRAGTVAQKIAMKIQAYAIIRLYALKDRDTLTANNKKYQQ